MNIQQCLFPLLILASAQTQLIEDGLILDLDADKAVELEVGYSVHKWRNQVAHFPAKEFVKQDKGRAAGVRASDVEKICRGNRRPQHTCFSQPGADQSR